MGPKTVQQARETGVGRAPVSDGDNLSLPDRRGFLKTTSVLLAAADDAIAQQTPLGRQGTANKQPTPGEQAVVDAMRKRGSNPGDSWWGQIMTPDERRQLSQYVALDRDGKITYRGLEPLPPFYWNNEAQAVIVHSGTVRKEFTVLGDPNGSFGPGDKEHHFLGIGLIAEGVKQIQAKLSRELSLVKVIVVSERRGICTVFINPKDIERALEYLHKAQRQDFLSITAKPPAVRTDPQERRQSLGHAFTYPGFEILMNSIEGSPIATGTVPRAGEDKGYTGAISSVRYQISPEQKRRGIREKERVFFIIAPAPEGSAPSIRQPNTTIKK